jgi:NAD(P)-dependent dehydrogenase (short-subunit alcohol dehydrogenase family)
MMPDSCTLLAGGAGQNTRPTGGILASSTTETMIALITGASRGIGREIAAQLAALGHSSAGSLAKLADLDDHNPVAIGYVPSKTAVTALTLQYAKGLASEHILVNAVDPGFVATELNNFSGVRTPAQGAVAAVQMATIPAGGPTGTFTDDQGTVAW